MYIVYCIYIYNFCEIFNRFESPIRVVQIIPNKRLQVQ